MKTKSIQIDEVLFNLFKDMNKHEGDSWNDVIAKTLGFKDYVDFRMTTHTQTVLSEQSTKGLSTTRCDKTRCDRTIDWVEAAGKVANEDWIERQDNLKSLLKDQIQKHLKTQDLVACIGSAPKVSEGLDVKCDEDWVEDWVLDLEDMK